METVHDRQMQAMLDSLAAVNLPYLPFEAMEPMAQAVEAGMREVAESSLPDDEWVAGVREYAPARGELPEVIRFHWAPMSDAEAMEEFRHEISDYFEVSYCRARFGVSARPAEE